jgi:hypothetical protein
VRGEVEQNQAETMRKHLREGQVPRDNDPNQVDYWPFMKKDGQDFVLTPPKHGWLYPKGLNDSGVVVGALLNGAGFRWDTVKGTFEEILHPSRRDGFQTYITDIDNQGRMVAVNERLSDGYTESWWLRPITPPKVAQR